MNVRSRTVNMTEGNVVAHIVKFALPMFVGNLFQQLYNLVDSIVVGRFVGADGLAAVGATGSVTFLFFALCNGIGNGGGIITSQFFGTRDDTNVRKTMVNTAYIMAVMSLSVGAVAYILTGPILRLLNTPDKIITDSITYMQLQCIGLIFVALYNYAASMLRALGDSRTPLIFLVISCFINGFLDVFFVCFLHMGVFGAAFATVISQLLSGASCLIFAFKTNEYFKFNKELARPDRVLIVRTIRLGVPLSLQFALIAISCMALQRVVNGYGAVAVAAFTATSRVEQIIHQPYQTMGASLSTFSGQNYGARKNDRVVMGLKKSMVMMAVFSLLMLPVIQFGGTWIVKIFVEDAAVIEMGAAALRITSYFYVCLGTIYVVRSVLTGVGDAVFALQNGIVEVICRLTIPFLFTMIPVMGVWGIWWSVGATWTISGLTAVVRYLDYSKKIGLRQERNMEVNG